MVGKVEQIEVICMGVWDYCSCNVRGFFKYKSLMIVAPVVDTSESDIFHASICSPNGTIIIIIGRGSFLTADPRGGVRLQ